ncbi:MAG: TrkA family potassium uptake protein [Candidatus Sedimenticola sp. PURPLELP]
MHSKVVIFGCNALSMEVAMRLHERAWDMTLVSKDKMCLEGANNRGFKVVEADYTDDEELKRLGIGLDVDIVFTLFEDDAQNVFLTISAKDLSPTVKVISLAQSKDSAHKLEAAGVSKVIDPYEISGRKIHDMLKRPLIAETIEKLVYGKAHLNLAEVTVASDSFLDGRRLGELALSDRYNLVLLGVVDRELGDEFIFSTSGVDHKLDKDDVLVVIGPGDEIARLQRDSAEAEPEH